MENALINTEKLKQFRVSEEMTRPDMAKALCTSVSSYNNFEAGRLKSQTHYIYLLCRYFDVEPETFMDEQEAWRYRANIKLSRELACLDKEKFGNWIKKKKLTQEEGAAIAGVSVSTWKRYMKEHSFSYEAIIKICSYYGVEIKSFQQKKYLTGPISDGIYIPPFFKTKAEILKEKEEASKQQDQIKKHRALREEQNANGIIPESPRVLDYTELRPGRIVYFQKDLRSSRDSMTSKKKITISTSDYVLFEPSEDTYPLRDHRESSDTYNRTGGWRCWDSEPPELYQLAEPWEKRKTATGHKYYARNMPDWCRRGFFPEYVMSADVFGYLEALYPHIQKKAKSADKPDVLGSRISYDRRTGEYKVSQHGRTAAVFESFPQAFRFALTDYKIKLLRGVYKADAALQDTDLPGRRHTSEDHSLSLEMILDDALCYAKLKDEEYRTRNESYRNYDSPVNKIKLIHREATMPSGNEDSKMIEFPSACSVK